LFHADRRTDGRTDEQAGRHTARQKNMTKLIVAFRDFANAPKMVQQIRWFGEEKIHICT